MGGDLRERGRGRKKGEEGWGLDVVDSNNVKGERGRRGDEGLDVGRSLFIERGRGKRCGREGKIITRRGGSGGSDDSPAAPASAAPASATTAMAAAAMASAAMVGWRRRSP